MTANKIQQLASQAYVQASIEQQIADPSVWYTDQAPNSELVHQKFADLLIQECYEWVKDNGGLHSEFDLQDLKAHLGMKP